jgi:hypothetical protein
MTQREAFQSGKNIPIKWIRLIPAVKDSLRWFFKHSTVAKREFS